MKLPLKPSMSRLFRLFLLTASCLFALFFVYYNVKVTRRLPYRKALIHSKHLQMSKANRLADQSSKNSNINRVRPRQNEASFFDAESSALFVNSTFRGRERNRLTDMKTAIVGIRTTEKSMLHDLEEKQNQALKDAQKSVVNEKILRSREQKWQLGADAFLGAHGNDEPVVIFILARMRTGSSLMGEIFNQNPSIFFLYEPLISLDYFIRAGDIELGQHQHISSSLLREYSQCRFPKAATELWIKWRAGLARSARVVPYCHRSRRTGVPYCGNISVQNLTDICMASHRRVCIKTIRSDLDYLKPLVDAGINVKVIHLVRDPRGTTNSRKLYYSTNRARLPGMIGLFRNRSGGISSRLPGRPPGPLLRMNATKGRFKGKLDVLGLLGDYPDHVVHTIPRLCQWTRDSILQVKEKPTWLRNRYKLVRYEDFALDPLRMAKELYEFVGINFPRSVVNWIVMNTRTNDERSVKLFSTHKNSVMTATRWRTSLRPAQVKQVEDVCGEAMELLGYKKAATLQELTNQSIPLMDPLPIDDTI